MHSASGAGVKAVNGTQSVDGLFNGLNRAANKTLLQRTFLAMLVARSQVPSGRNDDLIAINLAVGNLFAVVQSTTRSFPEARTRTGGTQGLLPVRGVAALNGFDQLIAPLLHELSNVNGFNLTNSNTAQGGLQVGELQASSLQHSVDVALDGMIVAQVSHTWEP